MKGLYRDNNYSSNEKNADNKQEDEVTEGCDTNDKLRGEDESVTVRNCSIRGIFDKFLECWIF